MRKKEEEKNQKSGNFVKAVVALDDEEVICNQGIWFICDETYACEVVKM